MIKFGEMLGKIRHNPNETKPNETKIEQYPTSLEEMAEELSKISKIGEEKLGEGLICSDQLGRSINIGLLLKQKKEELISEPTNFQELFEVLDRIDSLKEINSGSDNVAGISKNYDIAEIKEIIGKVQEKPDDIKYITRSLGLRQKVKELLASEQELILMKQKLNNIQ